MTILQRLFPMTHKIIFLTLAFWAGTLLSKDVFLPADPNEPVGIECEPKGTGTVYRVITWTQVIGVEEREPDKPPVLKGLARIAVYGGEEAVTILCPVIHVDGKTDGMYSRGPLNPSFECFPVSVCEYPITSKNREIVIETPDGSLFSAPALVADVRKIGVIGDTGCRNNKKQSCAERYDWPFKTLISDLAGHEPDLLVHLGDYRYSKTVCETVSCADNWQNWLFEFFLPAKPLLDKAPLAVARGNHESCGQSGPGWFLLLQPERAVYPYRTCRDKDPNRYKFPPVWFFDVGNGKDDYRFLVLDSSLASDYPEEDVASYRILAEQIDAAANRPGYAAGALITHKPVWGAKGEKKKKKLNSTLQDAFDNELPSKIEIVQSGHIHTHQQVAFPKKTKRPFQVVTGNGGVSLNLNIEINGKVKLAGEKAAVVLGQHFGYDLWIRDESRPGSWLRTARFLDWSETGEPKWSELPIKP